MIQHHCYPYPKHGCPYCEPRCPCCGRRLRPWGCQPVLPPCPPPYYIGSPLPHQRPSITCNARAAGAQAAAFAS